MKFFFITKAVLIILVLSIKTSVINCFGVKIPISCDNTFFIS